MVKLGEVCDILDFMRVPVTASKRKKGIYPYYGANGVKDYVDDYIFDDELVLLAEDGGNFCSKEKPIAYRVSGKCWVNNHAHVLKPKDLLDVNYLCYSIMFYDVSKLISGTTRAKLNQASVKKMQIPLAPLDVQKHIADILDKTQEIIDSHKKQLEELDYLIKATFYDMFGDPVSNTKNWNYAKLEELGSMSSGGTPSRRNKEYFCGEIDWYTAGELNCLFLEESIEKITTKAIKESSTKLFKKGSLLIGMYDTAAFKMGILKKDSCANQACANICLNINSFVDISWLYYNLLFMRNYFLENRRGIRQKNLNLGMIKKFEIPMPNFELQNKFAEIVSKLEEQKSIVKQSITESENLFNSLMSKYFD